jgi:hypothetical protein
VYRIRRTEKEAKAEKKKRAVEPNKEECPNLTVIVL